MICICDLDQDEEEALLEEMQAVKDKLSQKQRREKKRKLESKRKFRLRAAQLTKGTSLPLSAFATHRAQRPATPGIAQATTL